MPLTQVSPGLLDSNAQYYGFKNRLINGLATVQQRAAVAISGAYQYGVCDRWAVAGGGTPTAGSITSFAAGNNTLSGQAIAITGYSATGTGTVPSVQQRIEQKNCYDLRSSTVTVSALVYQDTGSTLTYGFNFAKFGSLDVYSGATFLGSATMSQATVPSGVWTRIVGTYTFGANDCDNGIALSILVPTYNTAIVTKNFYYSELQLEKGAAMTSFDYRPYGTELMLCQRYYWRNASSVSSVAIASGVNYLTTLGLCYIQMPVPMRASPTGSVNSPGNFAVIGGGNGYVCSSIAFSTSPFSARVEPAISGATAGQGNILQFNNTSGAIEFTAEL